jgi:hypothetical protein
VQNSFTSYDLAGAASRHAAHRRQIRTPGSNRPGERGLLILARGAEPRIEVEAATNGDTLDAHLRDQAMTGEPHCRYRLFIMRRVTRGCDPRRCCRRDGQAHRCAPTLTVSAHPGSASSLDTSHFLQGALGMLTAATSLAGFQCLASASAVLEPRTQMG